MWFRSHQSTSAPAVRLFARTYFLLFKLSLRKGELHDDWLLANVTPIFKKGSALDPANYRPVSLTSVPYKVLEKMIRDRIMEHLVDQNLVVKEQHGFVHRKACVTNLLETLDFLTRAKADDIITDMILLDFAKAFDKVSHWFQTVSAS